MVKEFTEPALTLSRDGVHIASADVSEALSNKKLSASLITGLEGCHARWVADTFVLRDLLEEEPDNAARRGSLFHKIMEDFFTLDASERTKEQLNVIANQVLESDEFSDMLAYPEAIMWLKQAVRNYYAMGAKPNLVEIATIKETTREGKEYDKKGLEIFVKGNIGGTKRDILGFIDRLVIDPRSLGNKLIIEDWKGLALDTLLPTVDGWTTMEKVRVGDKILSTNGRETTVLAKSQIHNRPCYKITFFDNSSVVCDNVHLWDVRLANNSKNKKIARNAVLNTDELFDEWRENGRDFVQIRNPEPIVFKKRALPINPYILGVWLGDGHNRDGVISVGNKDLENMMSNISENWAGEVSCYSDNKNKSICLKKNPTVCSMGSSNCGKSYATLCVKCKDIKKGSNKIREMATNVSLTTLLKRNNLTQNKHIPLAYLRSSIEQRLELLRGLMDTDGYWHSKRKRALFYTSDKALADGISELIVSLGITPTIYRGENDHKGFYEVGFSPIKFNPFKLARKAKMVEKHLENKNYRTHKALHRVIRNIEIIDSVPTQCIKVDSENSLYLCGPLMTPTHNTGAKVKRWKSHTKSTEGLGETRQQVIYSMLLGDMGYDVSGARLIYPVAKEIVNINLKDEEFKNRVVEDVQEADKKLDALIESNEFEFTPGFLCAWCSLAKICPSAQIKPYQKMQDAYAQQPDASVLRKGIEIR